MKRVVFDTNFLMDMVRFKLRLEELENLIGEKCEFEITNGTINELKKLAKGGGRKAMLARTALEIAKNFKIVKGEKEVDEVLLSLASDDTIIATNDERLRKKIRERGFKTIYVKGRKYFGMG